MNKRFLCLFLALLMIVMLPGCAFGTVNNMYRVPKRSEKHRDLQYAIDSAMTGMEYSAPRSGENLQTVQVADLNGDGISEYLLFAKGTGEKPLQILIFQQTKQGYSLVETIDSFGTSFDRVEYVSVDDRSGLDLVVGCQLSDQVLRSVSVYTFPNMQAQMLMNSHYTEFLTCDLDSDKRSELLILRPGESEALNGVAEYYSYTNGIMERSMEAEMSNSADKIKRIMISCLEDRRPAVFVASSVDESSIVTDIFSVVNDTFTNVTMTMESGTGVATLRNYYVYADDIDNDGVVELPELRPMLSLKVSSPASVQHLIRWYSVAPNGKKIDKLYTYHNFIGGWYLQLEESLIDGLNVLENSGSYTFSITDPITMQSEELFTIFTFIGNDRDEQAVSGNRFLLHRGDSVVYAAELEVASAKYGMTPETLTNHFFFIQQDWKTGET